MLHLKMVVTMLLNFFFFFFWKLYAQFCLMFKQFYRLIILLLKYQILMNISVTNELLFFFKENKQIDWYSFFWPRIVLSSLCSWRWPWIPDLPAFASQGLRFPVRKTMLYVVLGLKPRALHTLSKPSANWALSLGPHSVLLSWMWFGYLDAQGSSDTMWRL